MLTITETKPTSLIKDFNTFISYLATHPINLTKTNEYIAVYYGKYGNFDAKNNYWGTTEKAEVLKTHDYLKIDAVPFLTESPVPVGDLTKICVVKAPSFMCGDETTIFLDRCRYYML